MRPQACLQLLAGQQSSLLAPRLPHLQLLHPHQMLYPCQLESQADLQRVVGQQSLLLAQRGLYLQLQHPQQALSPCPLALYCLQQLSHCSQAVVQGLPLVAQLRQLLQVRLSLLQER